jgi:hypothetical protein
LRDGRLRKVREKELRIALKTGPECETGEGDGGRDPSFPEPSQDPPALHPKRHFA